MSLGYESTRDVHFIYFKPNRCKRGWHVIFRGFFGNAFTSTVSDVGRGWVRQTRKKAGEKRGLRNGKDTMHGASHRNNATRRRSPETPSIKNITPSCPRHPPSYGCREPSVFPWPAAPTSLRSHPAPLWLAAATGPNNNVPLLDLHSLYRALKYASHEDRRAVETESSPRTLELERAPAYPIPTSELYRVVFIPAPSAEISIRQKINIYLTGRTEYVNIIS